MLNKKIGILALAVVLTTSVLVGCSKKNNDDSGNEIKGNITSVGSSALLPLAESAGKEFSKIHPDVIVNVQGGGSGQGLSQIIAGTVEVGNSDIFIEEKNITNNEIKDNKVAVVGVGPVINKNIKIDNITGQQLKDIFTGKIKNWKEVGGPDLNIVLINRAEGSGTRSTFEKFGLGGVKSAKAQEQDNSGSVQKIVAQTPGAISYLSFSYFNDTIKALKIDGVEPNAESVGKNDWKIWSYEHMYTRKDANRATIEFIEFVRSDEVQKNVVAELGYIPINVMKVERNAQGEITELK
ncbi:phosphate ABC transporter substrate-binding protein PstS family protein [Peptostreptococcus faecalis]|uniref:phosphate ABC transporter substrate-binding protein PstS family protein n=1 Tax=Peptostreptococcus faecalis TaxID=2045015 RepID=UPI000C79CFC6|nr:phosphate ABC transporter substrate-binding protein PstS family protein [Peptostreptococcus faecalis]